MIVTHGILLSPRTKRYIQDKIQQKCFILGQNIVAEFYPIGQFLGGTESVVPCSHVGGLGYYGVVREFHGLLNVVLL